MALMRSAPAGSLRDRTLMRLADSCDDAMPLMEKAQQTRQQPRGNTSPRRQIGRQGDRMQNQKPVVEMSLTEIHTLVATLEASNEELTGLAREEMREAGEISRAQLAIE